jgi:hypothetical protein
MIIIFVIILVIKIIKNRKQNNEEIGKILVESKAEE